MKKLAAMMLTMLMIASLAACGNSGNSDDAGDSNGDTAGSAAESQEEDGASASDSDMAYVKEKGTLVVGITEFEPMDYKDENGDWIGFRSEERRVVKECL